MINRTLWYLTQDSDSSSISKLCTQDRLSFLTSTLNYRGISVSLPGSIFQILFLLTDLEMTNFYVIKGKYSSWGLQETNQSV